MRPHQTLKTAAAAELTDDGAPGRMKYPSRSGEPQLYDLRTDSREERNRAVENPKLVRDLSARLDEWYVANQRQTGKFVPAASKLKRN